MHSSSTSEGQPQAPTVAQQHHYHLEHFLSVCESVEAVVVVELPQAPEDDS